MKSVRRWIAVLGVVALVSCAPQETSPVVRVAGDPLGDDDYWDVVRGQGGPAFELVPVAREVSPDLVWNASDPDGAVDLREAFEPEALQGFVPVAVDPRLQGGRLTRLPSTVSATHVFYAHRLVLEGLGLKPATTYEELVAQVPVLRAAGVEVVAMANREPWVLEATLFSALVGRLAGSDFVTVLGEGRARFTDEGFVAALATVQGLVADGVLSRKTLLVGSNEVARPFVEGRAAYLIDGDWRLASFTTDPATGRSPWGEDQDAVELLVFPTVPGQVPDAPATSVALGPGYSILSGRGQRQTEVVAVLERIEGAAAQTWRRTNRGVFPSRSDVDQGGLEPLERAHARFFLHLTGTPVLEGHLPAGVLATLQRGLRALVLGTTTPNALAEELQREWDRQ